MSLANTYNLMVIEDCAEAIGSMHSSQIVGTFGDASIFSFFGNKTISTGEGGMLLFKERRHFEHAKILRDHGMNPNKRYWHEFVGFNYRMTNMQAALGVAQLERLNSILSIKRNLFSLYNRNLSSAKHIRQLPFCAPHEVHSNWLFTILLDSSINRTHLIQSLLGLGIETRPVFYPLSSQPPYKNYRHSLPLDSSTIFSRCALSLPSSATVSNDQCNYISSCLVNLLESN